jgi:Spy/CpxP family protein refolding chaperone
LYGKRLEKAKKTLNLFRASGVLLLSPASRNRRYLPYLFGDGMSWIKLAVAGIALCAGASVAGAQGAPAGTTPPQGAAQGGQGRGGRGMAMLMEGITLTEAQQAKLDEISAKYRAERQKLMPNGMQGGPPEEGVRAKIGEMMEKQSAEIRAILTADQQKVFDTNVEKRKQMMQRPPAGR